MTTAGYHAWRKTLQGFHADTAARILRELDVDATIILRVRDLLLMKNFPRDPETQMMEDADCLTFLETKFEQYLGTWDEPKILRILRGTLGKMSPGAVKRALEIRLPVACRTLIERAMSGPGAGV